LIYPFGSVGVDSCGRLAAIACADGFACWERGIGAHTFGTRDVGLRADFQSEEM
jgi:hypothetical protein